MSAIGVEEKHITTRLSSRAESHERICSCEMEQLFSDLSQAVYSNRMLDTIILLINELHE